MTEDNDSLRAACAFWQAGRDGGSSLVRGAARVITGVPHYVCAPFIHDIEDQARHSPLALAHGAVLLNALERAALHDPSEWALEVGVSDHYFAGRGLASNRGKDEQIEQRLRSGRIDMSLWGLSLDRAVTEQYGGRFLFEITGPFPAVPAWLVSHVKEEEKELISGGQYAVDSVEQSEGVTRATLRWESPVLSRRICDVCAVGHERP